jgi:hypothetical protein
MTEASGASDIRRQGADQGEVDESSSIRVGQALLEEYSI